MGTWTFGDITYPDAGEFFLKTELRINISLCRGAIKWPDINGEAYPENSFMSATYTDYIST